MNRILTILMFFFYCSVLVYSSTPTSNYLTSYYNKSGQSVLLIDNFEDGELMRAPEWWSLGNLELLIEEHQDEPSYLGKKSLMLRGKTSDWVIGGIGVYIGQDASALKALKCYVRGYGEESGNLIFELYDDDNNSPRVELHPDYNIPLYDDRFIYTLKVTWDGWRTVMIDIDQFRDDNVGIGDDIWNPYRIDGSSGLVQMQIVAMGEQQQGKIHCNLDEIKLYSDSKKHLFDLPYLGAPPRVITDDDSF